MEASVAANWLRLERALSTIAPPGVALAPGASESALVAFENATALTLPSDAREFFRQHDGQTSTKAGLACGFFFVSLSEAQKLLSDWATTRAKLGDGIKELDRACSSTPPKAIQRKYSCAGWVPLARDHEGNAIGIDVAPGPTGTVGQIINFGRDEEDKFVLFASVNELLDWLAIELEAGRIAYDEVDGVVRHRSGRLPAAILSSRNAGT